MSAPLPTSGGMPMQMSQRPAAPAEKSALSSVMWFGILQLAGLVAGWVSTYYLFGTLFASAANLNLPPNPTPQQVSAALGPVFQDVLYIIPLSAAFQFIGLVLLLTAFRRMRTVDQTRFNTPAVLIIVMILGLLLALAGAVPLINGIPGVLANVNTTPGAQQSPAFVSLVSSLLLYVALIALGGLLVLIGLIGGEILGLWRMGSRYDETLLKLGAIFVVIPLLNIVAPILILLGAHSANGRLTVQPMGISQ